MSFQLNLETDLVRHLRTAEPVCVAPTDTVAHAIALMNHHHTGCVVVCRADQVVGILTERDILRMMDERRSFDLPVTEVMTANPTAISQHDSVGSTIRSMSHGGYRRLPIVDPDGKIVAMLKVSDILRYLVEHFPQYIYNLPPAPHHMLAEREGA